MFDRRDFLETISGAAVAPGIIRRKGSITQSGSEVPGFFPGFQRTSIQTAGTKINVLIGGKGPPLLLIHGYPETHVEWRKVAPELAKTHTVIATDLRGYGDSGKPRSDSLHLAYSKRAMADDQVEVMAKLGFDEFGIIAHDRGARVAHRLIRDHPDRVVRAILMDICPTSYMYKTADRAFASAYFHWFFLIQDEPLPERMIANDVDGWLRYAFDPAIPVHVGPEAYAEYLRCFSDQAVIHASCEDYRASASIDLEHDAADEGRKIRCPLRVLWGARGFVGRKYNVLEVWRGFAEEVSGTSIESGHWIAEEAAGNVIVEAQRFFA
jgi:haloacetate dehalogenase